MDLVALGRVHEIYRQVVKTPGSIVSLETACVNPWTYPNLNQEPKFVREVQADGRFVGFLEHFRLLPHAAAGRSGL